MNEPRLLPTDEQGFYRVEASDAGECGTCHQSCVMWTIVYNDENDEPTEVGQSWGDREITDDICELMNMAHAAGHEKGFDEGREAAGVEL